MCSENRRGTAKRDRKRQTPKGGRRLAPHTPLLKNPCVDSLHTLSPRVPWRRPRVRSFRPSGLVTVSVPPTKTRPTIPEPAAGAGVCPPRTLRPNVAASSVHERSLGSPNTQSNTSAQCSQSSSPPFSRRCEQQTRQYLRCLRPQHHQDSSIHTLFGLKQV